MSLANAIHWEIGDICACLQRDWPISIEGETTILGTRVRARYPVRAAPRFQVYPPHIQVGGDERLGDSYDPRDTAFDDYFQVVAEEPKAAARVLTQPWRQHMLQWVRDARVVSDGYIVEVFAPWATHNDKRIVPLVDLAVGLANADIFGLSALRKVPGATYRAAAGKWQRRTVPRAEVRLPAAITIAPMRRGRRPVTRLELQQPLELPLKTATTSRPLPGVLADRGVSEGAWRELGDGTLKLRRRTTRFTWSNVVTDPAQLVAGIELMRTLTRGPTFGAYR